jgi:glycosyltransferase involved in cell wall biosynthesis
MDEVRRNPNRTRPIVLVLTDYYRPGFRHGGPIRSIQNLVSGLGAEFDFRILTRDRDVGSQEPYPIVRPGEWQAVEGCSVRYLPAGHVAFGLLRLLRSTSHDVLYLNSYFSPAFSILPLLLRRIRAVPRKTVVIAPRGELYPGALGIKPHKKRAWNLVAKGLGLYRDVIWQATTMEESIQIRAAAGNRARVLLGPVLSRAPEEEGPAIFEPLEPKVPGTARVVFFSRISPKKNLEFALAVLDGRSTGHLTFDIYGAIDDPVYWAGCQRRISRSRAQNVVITYKGELPHEEVGSTLSRYDVLLMPTLGENFGHVIFEALSSGCPVAISDKTPWVDVETEGAGWVIPLSDEERWRAIVEDVVNADEETLRLLRSGAVKLARSRNADPGATDLNRRLFGEASRGHPSQGGTAH